LPTCARAHTHTISGRNRSESGLDIRTGPSTGSRGSASHARVGGSQSRLPACVRRRAGPRRPREVEQQTRGEAAAREKLWERSCSKASPQRLEVRRLISHRRRRARQRRASGRPSRMLRMRPPKGRNSRLALGDVDRTPPDPINLSIYLSIDIIYLSLYLSIYPSIHLSILSDIDRTPPDPILLYPKAPQSRKRSRSCLRPAHSYPRAPGHPSGPSAARRRRCARKRARRLAWRQRGQRNMPRLESMRARESRSACRRRHGAVSERWWQ
jgi:hypothetical protein